MKKQIITILLISLLIFGCTQTDMSDITDCGENMDCFEEKLTYCEPVTVIVPTEKAVWQGSLPNGEPIVRYMYVEGSKITINPPKSKLFNYCEVSFSKIKPVNFNINGQPIKPIIYDSDKNNFRINCYYRTCMPFQEEKCERVPEIAYCDITELRKENPDKSITTNEQIVDSQLNQVQCYTPECFETSSGCKVGDITIPEKVTIYSDFESIPNQTKVEVKVFDNAPKNCVVTYYGLIYSKNPSDPKINLLCQKPQGETTYHCGGLLVPN